MGVFGTREREDEVDGRTRSSASDAALSVSEKSTILGPWKVWNLDPWLVKLLTVVGFAVPVIVYLVFLQHYSVNAMWQDQWDDVPVIRQSFGHFPDWSSLWVQHVDNRILFPNLIVVALAHTVHYNITVEEYLSALMLIAATTLLVWCHKRRSPTTPLLFYCPVAFLTLTLAQWQNTIWGFQMAWYVVLLSLAATIALLDRRRFVWIVFALAIVAAVVCSYSSIQGLLVWPVGLILLCQRRRPLQAVIAWIIAAVATTVLYFLNFTSSQVFNPNESVLKQPFDAVKFFVFALGDVVGLQETNPQQSNAWIMAFGVVILVLAVLVLLRWGLRRDEYSAAPIGIALIVYGLLFDALITQGRLFLLYFAASASRYTTNDVLVLAGIYLTVLSRSPATEEVDVRLPVTATGRWTRLVAWVRLRVGQIDRIPVRQIALVAIVLQLAFSFGLSFSGARGLHEREVKAAAVTSNIDRYPVNQVEFDLYFVRKAKWLREQTEFLREHHLSQFG